MPVTHSNPVVGMLARRVRLRATLAKGGCGVFARLRTSEAYEALAQSTADFVVIDHEHGSFSPGELSACVLAAQAGGLAVIIRFGTDDLSLLQQAVTIGTDGIIVAHCNDPARVSDWVKFLRGRALERAWAGAGRASARRAIPWSEFREMMHRDLVVIAQIDEPEGLGRSCDIVQVPGLDGLFYGTIGFALADAKGGVEALNADLADARAQRPDAFFGYSIADPHRLSDDVLKNITFAVSDSDIGLLQRAVSEQIHLLKGFFPT